MIKRVRVTPSRRAEEDLASQVDHYLSEGSPQTAARFLEAVDSALERLSQFPDIGSLCDFEEPLVAATRAWSVPGFHSHRVFYRRFADDVEVLRILHVARDIPEVLRDSPTHGSQR